MKVRIWDDDNEVFSFIDFNDLDKAVEELDSFRDYFSKDYFKDNPKYWQRFTGLTDKNGVEIYEGDIIIFHEPDSNWKFEVIYTPTKACFSLNSDSNFSQKMSALYSESIEVCGNIQES